MIKILYIFYFFIFYNANYHTEISEAEDKWNMRSHLMVETYLLTFAYDGQNLQNFNEILKSFQIVAKDPFPNKLDLQIVFADFSKIPELDKELKISKTENHLIFYIQKIPHKYPNFSKLLKGPKPEISSKILNFIKSTISDLSSEITTISQIESLLSKNQIIPLYMGLENYHYALYKLFASKHKEKKFYHTFNKPLISKLFRNYTSKQSPKKDAFAILRNNSLITKYDAEKLVFMTQLYSTRSLNHFYDYEIFPKLRSGKFARQNIELLKKDKFENMLIYFYDRNRNERNWDEFCESVVVLPKRFIYAHVDLEGEYVSDYLRLFGEAGVSVEREKVFAVHVLNGVVGVREFFGTFSKPNLTKFVMDYYEGKVKKMEEDVVREEEEEEVQIGEL